MTYVPADGSWTMPKPNCKTVGRRYVQRYDGEPFEVKTAFIDRCCDCGLVHVNKLRVERRGKRNIVWMTAWRDNRRTASSRRGKKFKRK